MRCKARDRYYGNDCHSHSERSREAAEALRARSARNDTKLSSFIPTAMVEIDDYIIDTLMPDLVNHDRQPSAFLVYLYLWRRTHGTGEDSAQVSLFDLATGTGLSKRAVQEALRWLSRRRLLSIQRASITAIPVYTVKRPWLR